MGRTIDSILSGLSSNYPARVHTKAHDMGVRLTNRQAQQAAADVVEDRGSAAEAIVWQLHSAAPRIVEVDGLVWAALHPPQLAPSDAPASRERLIDVLKAACKRDVLNNAWFGHDELWRYLSGENRVAGVVVTGEPVLREAPMRMFVSPTGDGGFTVRAERFAEGGIRLRTVEQSISIEVGARVSVAVGRETKRLIHPTLLDTLWDRLARR